MRAKKRKKEKKEKEKKGEKRGAGNASPVADEVRGLGLQLLPLRRAHVVRPAERRRDQVPKLWLVAHPTSIPETV